VNTNGASTFGASPPDLFVGKKFSNPDPSDILQILDHAHAVFGSISFIQMLQTSTWKSIALKAKPWFGILHEFTIFDFASNARDTFISVSSSAARAFIFFSQITHANATVHSAGSDE